MSIFSWIKKWRKDRSEEVKRQSLEPLLSMEKKINKVSEYNSCMNQDLRIPILEELTIQQQQKMYEAEKSWQFDETDTEKGDEL